MPCEPVLITVDHWYVIVVDILVKVEPEALSPGRSPSRRAIKDPRVLGTFLPVMGL